MPNAAYRPSKTRLKQGKQDLKKDEIEFHPVDNFIGKPRHYRQNSIR
jgi:hypothetical protein